MRKKVLVTGGLGFIGSHLAEALLASGKEVTIVDNQTSSVVDPGFFDKRCEVVCKSIRDWEPKDNFNEIYHLASPVGPLGVLDYGGNLGFEIVADTHQIAGWAMKMKAHLLFTSTSELYGRSGKFREADVKQVSSHVSVRLAYGVGKLLSEIDLLNYAALRKLWVIMVRPFNIAGPRQSAKGGFVLPRFIEQALAGKPITVYGDGSQVRSLTHVADVIKAMLLLMGKKEAKDEVFNIGNPRNRLSILEIAELVKKICNSRSKISLVDPIKLHGKRFSEAFNKIPDVSKMERMFGWSPRIKIDQIISDTLKYYRRKRI